MVDFHKGIAVKPSLLGLTSQERRTGLFRLYSAALLSGIDLFVIDSERMSDDFSVSIIAELFELADEVEGPVVVPTVPVRRSDFDGRMRELLECLSGVERGGLCLVAGNPHYLSVEEAGRRAGLLLMEAVGYARSRLGDGLIMVGTENVESVALRCCLRYRCLPFFLLDEGVVEMALSFRSVLDVPVAVYVPFFIGDGLTREAYDALLAYASRRRRMSRLVASNCSVDEALSRFMLVGDGSVVGERLRELWIGGFDVVVGFPACRAERQVYLFGGLVF